MNPVGLLLVAAGIFCVCGAVLNWDFFMNNSRAWLFVKIFGRNGARFFYVLLGAAITIGGVLMTLGIITDA
jgi:hypothetical protein